MVAVFLQFPPNLVSATCWSELETGSPNWTSEPDPLCPLPSSQAECDEINNIGDFTSLCLFACVLTDNAPHEILSC